MKSSEILVTGATGAIGFAIVKSLLKRNYKIRLLVRDCQRARKIFGDAVEYCQGDITDLASLRPAMEGIKIIYHAAGLPEQWLPSPEIFNQVNVRGTKNMLTVAREVQVERFVYTSTMDVFYAAQGASFDESIIDPNPKHTDYERSKQLADEAVSKALNEGLPVVFLHPAAVYGPSPTRSAGINQFFKDFYAGKIPALIPGGMSVVFVDDVGEGHVLAAEKARVGERFLLSESYQSFTSMVEVMDRIQPVKKVPPTIPWSIADLIAFIGGIISTFTKKPPLIPKGQLTFLKWQAHAKSDKAQKQLGWVPTSFATGVAMTLEKAQ